jgi:hypothetical protein
MKSEDEMGEACSTHGAVEICIPKGRSHLGDLAVYGTVILKWILSSVLE